MTNIPKAQQSYESSLKTLEKIDTHELFEKIAPLLEETVAGGGFTLIIQPIEPLVAEKASIELQELGYHVFVFNSQQMIPIGGNSYKPGAGIQMNWRAMPSNTRDKYSI